MCQKEPGTEDRKAETMRISKTHGHCGFFFLLVKIREKIEANGCCDKAKQGGRKKSKIPKWKHKNRKERRKRDCYSHTEKCKIEREKKKKGAEVKWSKALKEIEGMKVRDGENKIMEGGREIEKGTLGSRSKSV